MKQATTASRSAHYCLRLLAAAWLLMVSWGAIAQQQNAPQKRVSGVVTNPADNKPIPDVNIQVKGTNRGTTTNAQGAYSILAAEGETLVVSAIGFKIQEYKVGKSDRLNLQLLSTSTELEGVVVTALGIKREEKALGYATTVVQGEQLTDAMASNWTDALSGKVAGLNLVRSNGGPSGSNKIVLRGETNLTDGAANEALIVVDGVVMNLGSGRRTANAGELTYGTGSDNMPADYGSGFNDINPEDIESVTVLKGPGAAALYGERASGGAIIITTKSGASKKKGWGVSLNSNANIEQVNRWPDFQWEYGQGLNGANYYSYGTTEDGPSTSGTSSAYGPRFDGQFFYQWDPVTQQRGTERTLWRPYKEKLFNYFQTGTTLNNTISLEGGTEKTSARFSFSDFRNKWITPNTGMNRNNLALSVNTKVNDKLQIAAKINYNNRFSDNLPGAGYGNQSIMYWFMFWMPSADLDWLRNYWVNGQEQRRIAYPFSTFPENPYAIAYEFLNASNRNGFNGNVQATYNFTKDLSLMVRAGTDFSFEDRQQRRPYDAGSRLPKGSLREQSIFSQETVIDFLLRYQKKVNSDFDFSFTLGGSMLDNNYRRDQIRADSLTIPGLYSFANSAGVLFTTPYRAQFSINSIYGLGTLSYKNFLYFDATNRIDWSSTLSTPNRTNPDYFLYPSANLSFILSEVAQLPASVDFAKLRFSASSVGSSSTNPYRTSFNYDPASEQFGGSLTNPLLLANPNIRPLNTTTYELGANVKMFKKRLDVDVAVYTGTTKDQIITRVIDRSSGYSSALINAGAVNNRGFELSVNATPVNRKNGLKWTTTLVFSTNRNRITELPDSSIILRTGPVAGGQIVAKVGGSMGDLYGRGYVRSPDGQVVYDENTGYAKIQDEVVYLGNTIPRYRVGLTNDFRYKQWRFNFLFDAQMGAVAHSLMHYKLAEQGKTTNTLPGRYNGIIGNGVIQDADGKFVPNNVIATNIDEYYRSHWGIDNAEGNTFSTDFVKFREARIDYTIKPALLKKLGLQRATFGVYGRNLFIWSPWPMFDPEFGTLAGTDIVTGFEIAQFPSTRSLGINLILGF